MSTPIIAFDNGSSGTPENFSLTKNVGYGALKLYLAFSLPCVALTFLVWVAVYKWEKRRDAQRKGQQDEEKAASLC